MRIIPLSILLLLFTAPLHSQTARCFSSSALADLIERARAANSDGLVITHHGRVLVDENFDHDGSPVYIASAGKSLTSLAIGRLLATGALDSLDQPVVTLFPEWRQGRKRDITIRQLLNHTSGLQNHPNASVELEPPPTWRVPDVVRLALAAELAEEPGSTTRYNNKAVALLGGIIERASGKRMDTYFEDEFFRPMGITRYGWIRDEAGQPTAHGAFLLTARGLARFGELMLNRGTLDGRTYFSGEWVDTSFAQSQPHEPRWGLLWWRLPSTAAPADRTVAYYADGFRGNYLVVIPDAGVVAARVKGPARYAPETDGFTDFVPLVARLAEPCR